MRVRMKNLMGIMEGGSIPTLSNLEDAMKAEEKVPCLQLCICTLTHCHITINSFLIYGILTGLIMPIQWFLGKLYSVCKN